ncbi:putative peptidylprolyl isomerase [Helianthus debilis subsp. tardiflorus]
MLLLSSGFTTNWHCHVTVELYDLMEEDTVDEVYEITHRVFLDVDVDKQRLGRIVIGLYGEVVPKIVENLCALCTDNYGFNLY